jgi:hypothetical protein
LPPQLTFAVATADAAAARTASSAVNVRTLATIFSILAVALSLEEGSAGGGELVRAGSARATAEARLTFKY